MTGALLESDGDRATKLITSIGGPTLDPRDIEWTNDLEAGRLLLNWLSSQISSDVDGFNHGTGEITRHDENDGGTEDATGDGAAGLDATICVAMRDSTLENEEVIIADDARVRELLVTSTDQSQDSTPQYNPDYIHPSQLRKHANFITNQTNNVQQEADLYRARISQTKEAAKKINNSIKLLQRAIYDLNTKLRSEETLSELSIKADTTIEATITGSRGLLNDVGALVRNEKQGSSSTEQQNKFGTKLCVNGEYADLEEARAVLSKSKENIAALLARFEESTAHLHQLSRQDASKAADLQMEAARLQSAFDALESRTSPNFNSVDSSSIAALGDDAKAELQTICDMLEQEVALRDKGRVSGNGALDHLLSELHEGYIADRQRAKDKGKMQEQLCQAWSMDQAAILQLHEEVLDEALAALDSSLTPLEKVYASIVRLANCIQEAEAVLEAFAEELGDIYLPDASVEREGKQIQDEIDDAELERQMKIVLNDCKDLRPAGSPPLVLLAREDILAELRSLKARSARVEASERAWADALIHKYSIRPVHPMLPQIYAHAPANSSPPFAFPVHVRALEARARDKAAALNGLAQALDEEVREVFAKKSSVKRLDAFVEKWAETGSKRGD